MEKPAPVVSTLLPYIYLRKNVPRYFCRAAAGGTAVRGDICCKEPHIVRGFHISYKPSVYILAVTYKIYDALIGLEAGVITPEDSTMEWNRELYPFQEWNTDQG